VPLPNERIGDFSDAAADAAEFTLCAGDRSYDGLQFANNQIPSGRIDPFAAKIMALFPLPNQPGTQQLCTQRIAYGQQRQLQRESGLGAVVSEYGLLPVQLFRSGPFHSRFPWRDY